MRSKHFVVGFTVAAIAIAAVLLLPWNFWVYPLESRIAEVERLSGLTISSNVQLLYVRDERGGLLGDGRLVEAFALPTSPRNDSDKDCPQNFVWDSLNRVGALASDVKSLQPVPTHACILMRDAGPNRTDVVVLTGDHIFHVEIDL